MKALCMEIYGTYILENQDGTPKWRFGRSFSFSKGVIFRFYVSFPGSINTGGWEQVGVDVFWANFLWEHHGIWDVRCSVCLSLQHQSALFVSIIFPRERNHQFRVSSLIYATAYLFALHNLAVGQLQPHVHPSSGGGVQNLFRCESLAM